MRDHRGFFSVLFRAQTYLNLIYLFLAFPTGLAYFIALTVGFSLGLGLVVVLVGVPILAVTFLLTTIAVAFERNLANSLLDADIQSSVRMDYSGSSLISVVGNALRNSANWKGLIYLVAKFPFGILSFVISVIGVAIIGSLIAAPIGYLAGTESAWTIDGSVVISSFPAALLAFAAGVLLAPVAFNITNALANAWRDFAFNMLDTGDVIDDDVIWIDEKAKNVVSIPEDDIDDIIDEEETEYDKPKRKRVSLAELLENADDIGDGYIYDDEN
jgi:hypothetical protein